MIRGILVPLDGSLFSERVLPVAAAMARRTGATLHLVRVHVPYHQPPLSLEGMPVTDPKRDSRRWNIERAYVTRIRRGLGARSELPTRIAVVNGPVAEALATYAAAHGIDVIVMSTHARRGLARAWIGSVGDELLRRSPVPVLLVRAEEDAATLVADDARPRILIALDGSPLAEQIVEPAVGLGAGLGARYTLLRVVNPLWLAAAVPPVFAPWMGRGAVTLPAPLLEARSYLAGIAASLTVRGFDVDTKVVESESAADAILTEGERDSFGWIAMATHGRSGLSRLLFGSVAASVLRRAHRPLFVYRPKAGQRGLLVPAADATATPF